MTSLASQVILHPTVSQTLRLWGTTIGRDKTYRATQFLARFIAWWLLLRGEKDAAGRWSALKAHLATARKLMRLGKPLEHLQAALRTSQIASEPGEQLTSIGRQLGYFGYLAYDAVVWANAVKFINLTPEVAQNVNRTSNQFWFGAIMFSITHCLLKAGRIANEIKALRSLQYSEDAEKSSEREVKVRTLEVTRNAIRLQFIADVLDVWIPATSTGLVHLNDGVLGVFGFITSVMALRQQWKIAGSK